MTIKELINTIEDAHCACVYINSYIDGEQVQSIREYKCDIHRLCNELRKKIDRIVDEIKEVETEIKAVMDFIKNKDNTE